METARNTYTINTYAIIDININIRLYYFILDLIKAEKWSIKKIVTKIVIIIIYQDAKSASKDLSYLPDLKLWNFYV